jgi:hypothetical protein
MFYSKIIKCESDNGFNEPLELEVDPARENPGNRVTAKINAGLQGIAPAI